MQITMEITSKEQECMNPQIRDLIIPQTATGVGGSEASKKIYVVILFSFCGQNGLHQRDKVKVKQALDLITDQ